MSYSSGVREQKREADYASTSNALIPRSLVSRVSCGKITIRGTTNGLNYRAMFVVCK